MPSQALTLLERAQMDYPEQPGQMGGILMQEAECRWSTGDRAGSFEAYMRALAAQYRYPNVIRAIALSFAQRFYDHDGGSYAGILLDAIGEELKSWSGLEPYMKVRYAVVMARLHSHLNEKSDAGQCAKIALENLRRFVRARLTCNARGRRELARPYNRVGAQGQRGEVNLEPRFVRVSPSRIPILAGACRNRISEMPPGLVVDHIISWRFARNGHPASSDSMGFGATRRGSLFRVVPSRRARAQGGDAQIAGRARRSGAIGRVTS